MNGTTTAATGIAATPAKSMNGTSSSNSSSSTSKSNGTTNNHSSSNNSNDWSVGKGILPGRETIGPILLMIITPIFSILYYHICSTYNGNFYAFFLSQYNNNNNNNDSSSSTNLSFYQYIYNIWPTPYDSTTWYMIITFIVYQCILIKVVPGKTFTATTTLHGHRPTYTANGVSCYIITILSFIVCDYISPYNFKAYMVYDKFGTILSSMNIFAFIFCIGLVIKGYIAPSYTSDSGTTGSIIQDFYWGTELYPRIFNYDIKQMTNCRCGMMFWSIAIIAFGYKNIHVNHGQIQYSIAVSILLQLVYITKFFHWEMGYMCSMDIQHDRAGYYICWGCLVWVPAIYTSTTFYLTTNILPQNDISFITACCISICGLLCIWINYDSDRQRYIFRQTNGKCYFWNSNTYPKHIVAKYTTTTTSTNNNNGGSSTTTTTTTNTSLLLVDGYWSYSRHFHYVPEIMASFFWSCPAWDTGFIAPYFYVIYLTILLTDRAYRDDNRCRTKYGIYWEEYCHKVPYKIIPGVV